MRRTMLVVCTLALALCAGYAAAQTAPPADTLKVDYFANANTAGAPDATVRITNPGTSGGNLCADIYVFYSDQEMAECCGCAVTPDGLDTLSVNLNLTANPLTSTVPTNGVIKIVSSVDKGVCNPASLTPTAGVRAWATHIQTGFTITETASQDATLSTAEQGRLRNECYAIQLDGSGHGICSCGTDG